MEVGAELKTIKGEEGGEQGQRGQPYHKTAPYPKLKFNPEQHNGGQKPMHSNDRSGSNDGPVAPKHSLSSLVHSSSSDFDAAADEISPPSASREQASSKEQPSDSTAESVSLHCAAPPLGSLESSLGAAAGHRRGLHASELATSMPEVAGVMSGGDEGGGGTSTATDIATDIATGTATGTATGYFRNCCCRYFWY